MKTLVAFYSLEGNTDFIAHIIAEKLGADLIKLEPVKPYPTKGFKKFFIGGMSAVRKATPKLKTENIDTAAYDNIVLGSPVWAGTFAPPLNTLLKKQGIKGKKLAFFLCSGGGDVAKCLTNLKTALDGNTFVGEIDFMEPLKNGKEEAGHKAAVWAETLGL